MQAEALQIRARCGEMVEQIKALYGMDLSQVQVRFDLRGGSAGKAGGRGYRLPGSAYYVKFNRDMLTREAFEHVINDTVPHEYAHVVCFMDPSKGKNHDYGWQRVCRALGGGGARTHREDVVYGKGVTYEYITDRGHKVRLSEKRHRYVQGGGRLSYKRGMGVVTQMCAHSIVGVRGQTLAAPIVKQAPDHSDQVEMARRMAMVEALRVQQRISIVPASPAVPVQPFTIAVQPVATRPQPAESKAATSRRIMLSGYQAGQSYEQIIAAMMFANGYDRQLARATYKANAAKVGVPLEGA